MFSDPETLTRRLRRARRDDYSTVEVGPADARVGILIRVEILRSPGGLRELCADAIELAAQQSTGVRRIGDAGWWAGIVCMAAMRMGYPASVLRGTDARSRIHACIIVERSRMLDAWPAWPLVRIGTGRLEDLRGEVALSLGPSAADLLAYAERAGVHADVAMLRRMFEMGVLEWDSARDPESGRVLVRAARAIAE